MIAMEEGGPGLRPPTIRVARRRAPATLGVTWTASVMRSSKPSPSWMVLGWCRTRTGQHGGAAGTGMPTNT